MASVLASAVCLALDDPRASPSEPFQRALESVSLGFAIVFTVECLLKIFGLGLLRQRDAYLRDPWNILDLTVVLISWISIILTAADVDSGAVTALRALRALRPLRLVSRISAM